MTNKLAGILDQNILFPIKGFLLDVTVATFPHISIKDAFLELEIHFQ